MKKLTEKIKIRVSKQLFLRDPDESSLGRNIIKDSIILIDKIGFESFTFRKLAEKIHSTEASVYRYFENKHKLLIYLISWYWNWVEYRLVFATNNIESGEKKMKIAINMLSSPVSSEDPNLAHINEIALHNIVIAESAKAYLTKEVDKENKEGSFSSYKSLCLRIVEFVKEINPDYQYPASLVSTVIEGAHHQKYFSEHLPSLTDAPKNDDKIIANFLSEMVFNTLSKKRN
jgi:AcrR family transcriptional regulator